MVRRPAATGFIPAHSRKREIRPRGAIRRTLRVWDCIRDGAGRGQRIAACSTIARRATWTQALGSYAKTSLVERRPTKMGWQRRTRFQGRFQTERSHGPFHHESGGRRTTVAPLAAFADGPFSEFYEPVESPMTIRCIRSKRTIRWSSASKRRKTNTARRRTVTRLSARPIAYGALSLLDEEQSDECAIGSGAICGDCRRKWRTRWESPGARK